jgi:hypothetical protein
MDRDLLPAIGLSAVSLALIGAATLLTVPKSGPVGVLFGPGVPQVKRWEAVIQAGGTPIDEALGGMLMVAVPAGPGFAASVRHAGAWAVVNPGSVQGCRN